MDPTTQAHIDPSSLRTTSAGVDGIPVLVPVQATSTTNVNQSPTIPSSAHSTSQSTTSTTGKSTTSPTSPTTTGLRQRVNSLSSQLDGATRHPAVQNAKGQAQNQIQQVRQQLGRSQLVLDLEKRTGVDRVLLVAGGVLAYLILIPLNLFGLAFPTTNFLTFVPPVLLAVNVLDKESASPNDEKTKALLAYFVTFGFVQFAESLIGGVLAKRIPQYFTVKLLFLAYLIHPKTKGALKIHDSVLRPLLHNAQSANSSSSSGLSSSSRQSATNTNAYTPPTSNFGASSSANSPAAVPLPKENEGFSSSGGVGSGFSNASANTSGFSTTGGNNGLGAGTGSGSMFGQSGQSGTAHLPSGGGSGVGLEVRDDGGLYKPAY